MCMNECMCVRFCLFVFVFVCVYVCVCVCVIIISYITHILKSSGSYLYDYYNSHLKS